MGEYLPTSGLLNEGQCASALGLDKCLGCEADGFKANPAVSQATRSCWLVPVRYPSANVVILNAF